MFTFALFLSLALSMGFYVRVFQPQALCWRVSRRSRSVSMEQHPTHLAAIGILTQRPSGALERDMWAAYERHASRRVLLRQCVFEDETRERGPAIVVLQRPSYAPWAQLQCVAKILQWLRYAVDERLGRFVGWFDSDTWMHPQRLAAHLSHVQQAIPRGADVWGGFWEHWERAAWDQPGPPKSLGGIGFSYSPLGPVTAHKETDPAMRARSRAERRRFSFGMTQGGWTYFSAAAATRLVQHVLRRGAATFGFAVAGDGARLPPTRPGVCSMVTDVGIGWLGAQAFDGVALHAVSAHHMLETFTYPVRLLLPRCLASHRSEQPAVYSRDQ